MCHSDIEVMANIYNRRLKGKIVLSNKYYDNQCEYACNAPYGRDPKRVRSSTSHSPKNIQLRLNMTIPSNSHRIQITKRSEKWTHSHTEHIYIYKIWRKKVIRNTYIYINIIECICLFRFGDIEMMLHIIWIPFTQH